MKYMNKILMGLLIMTAIVVSGIAFYNTKAKAEENLNNNWNDIPKIKMLLKNGKKSYSVSIADVEKYHNGGDGVCLGLASGFRACQIAFSAIYPDGTPKLGDLCVISGTFRTCPADAITYITGVRYGKGSEGAFNGNYIFDKSIGQFNFVFINTSNGKAVKLVSKYKTPNEFDELQKKSKTNPELKNKFTQLSDSLARKILTAPSNEIFEVSPLPEFKWKEYKEKYLKDK